jgi:hypothetical protein
MLQGKRAVDNDLNRSERLMNQPVKEGQPPSTMWLSGVEVVDVI